MKPEDVQTVLDVFAECHRAAGSEERRLAIQQQAVTTIAQNPIKMADNLAYWLNKFGGNINVSAPA